MTPTWRGARNAVMGKPEAEADGCGSHRAASPHSAASIANLT